MIDSEINAYLLVAEQREQSVNNKASFLAVTAGVLVTAAVTQAWHRFEVFGMLTMLLASSAITLAAFALRPGSRPGDSPKRLLEMYLDSGKTERVIQVDMMKRKADTASERELALRGRARLVNWGFLALVCSCLALTAGVILELAPRAW